MSFKQNYPSNSHGGTRAPTQEEVDSTIEKWKLWWKTKEPIKGCENCDGGPAETEIQIGQDVTLLCFTCKNELVGEIDYE